MPYGDLLRALEAEIREQCAAVAEGARRESERIAEEGRRLSAEARAEALARAETRAEAIREEARRRSDAATRKAVLVAQAAELDALRAAAVARVGSRSSPTLTLALLAEAMADDDGSPLVLTCDPGHAGACRDWLAASRPEALARTTIVEAPAPRGGVDLAVGERLVVENTLPSRLELAWPALAVDAGRILFGGTGG